MHKKLEIPPQAQKLFSKYTLEYCEELLTLDHEGLDRLYNLSQGRTAKGKERSVVARKRHRERKAA